MKSKSIGANIRSVRLRLQMTQRELAEKTGIPVETIGRIERGATGVTLEHIIKLTEALHIPADHFISGRKQAIQKFGLSVFTIDKKSIPKKIRKIIGEFLISFGEWIMSD